MRKEYAMAVNDQNKLGQNDTRADFDNTIKKKKKKKKKKNYCVAEVYTGFKKWYGAGLRTIDFSPEDQFLYMNKDSNV